uniref:Uncharacterized protein n=1 Tax=Moniliophthora roreri TaxID=221103 RepID=A0A0W0GFF2_MONRR
MKRHNDNNSTTTVT